MLSGDDDRAEWIDFPVANEWIFVTLGVMTLLGFMLFTGLYLDIAKPL